MSHNEDEKDASSLADMPIERRDALVAQVWAFLTERGYTITYTGIAEGDGR